jgi:hypothetical protein
VITSPGWRWLDGVLLADKQAFAGVVTADGQEIGLEGFNFPPSTRIDIIKRIECITPNDVCGQVLQVREWPTVPEPGSILLFGAGLAGLGWARFRRGSDRAK